MELSDLFYLTASLFFIAFFVLVSIVSYGIFKALRTIQNILRGADEGVAALTNSSKMFQLGLVSTLLNLTRFIRGRR